MVVLVIEKNGNKELAQELYLFPVRCDSGPLLEETAKLDTSKIALGATDPSNPKNCFVSNARGGIASKLQS